MWNVNFPKGVLLDEISLDPINPKGMTIQPTDIPNVPCHNSFVPDICLNDPKSSLLLWTCKVLPRNFCSSQLSVTPTPKEVS